MQTRPYGFKFFGGLFVIALGALLALFTAVANGPDREVAFTREVPSKVSADKLAAQLDDLTLWPQWFHKLARVVALDDAGNEIAVQKLSELPKTTGGQRLRLFIDPKKGPWRRFEIVAQVTEYVPGKTLNLRIVEDTKGKLNELFSVLEWHLALVPQADGQIHVVGGARGQTRHWRSRLFGWMTPKILMHQVFYPNLIRLAEPEIPQGSSGFFK